MMHSRFVSVCIVLCMAIGTGCVADGPQPRNRPHIGPQPRDAQADVLLLNLGPATDSDGDTVPDTFVASVHVFDERYQLPVVVSGKMSFLLFGADQERPLQQWSFEDDDLRKQVIQAQVGPVYRFRLQVPIDDAPVREKYVTVQCLFEDSGSHRSQAWHRGFPWMSVPR